MACTLDSNIVHSLREEELRIVLALRSKLQRAQQQLSEVQVATTHASALAREECNRKEALCDRQWQESQELEHLMECRQRSLHCQKSIRKQLAEASEELCANTVDEHSASTEDAA